MVSYHGFVLQEQNRHFRKSTLLLWLAYLSAKVQSASAAAICPVLSKAMARLAGRTALVGSQCIPRV